MFFPAAALFGRSFEEREESVTDSADSSDEDGAGLPLETVAELSPLVDEVGESVVGGAMLELVNS